MIRMPLVLVVLSAALLGSPVAADTVVTPSAMQGWGAYTYGTSSPAPYGAVTAAFPHIGNGSAEISLADEGTTEVLWWYDFATPAPLAGLSQLSFDWFVSSTSTTPDFTTPAFGMYLSAGSVSGYIIWEGAYNGTFPSATQDTWVSSDILGDKFWWNGQGTGSCANAATYQTLAWFNTNCFGEAAEVVALAPFLGFGYAGTQFLGAIDNVAYGFRGGASDRFNFEVSAVAVPEPAGMALVLIALGALVVTRRAKQD